MSGISDFLAWLGGADLDTLRKSPRDRSKLVQMGCVLLTTAGIAALSMTFAIHNTMHLPVPTALLFGILWGLVILNLDRFLVISMGSTRNMKRLIGIAIPRLLMAVVVSLVVSTPITLEIFHNDIYATMTTMNLNQSTQVANDEANSALQREVNGLQGKITANQQILDGKLPDNITSAQLQTAQGQVAQLKTQVATAKQTEITAYATWQCELYGYGANCNGGSGKAGPGPIAQAKQQVYQQDVQTYDTLASEYKAAQSALATAQQSVGQSQKAATARYQQQAKQALPGLRSQLAAAQAQLAGQNANAQYTTNNNTGLLRQLQALFQASSGNPVLLLAHLTVAALFFLIELLPVLVKLLLNLGQPTTYEQLLKAEDDKLLDSVKADRRLARRHKEREADEEQQIADAASVARIRQALDMTKRQETLGLRANDTVAGKMEQILDAALAKWEAEVQATLRGGQPTAGPQQAAGQSPTWGTPANGQAPVNGWMSANGQQQPNGQQPNGYAPNGNGVPGHASHALQSGFAATQPVNGQSANGVHAANGQSSGLKSFGLPDAGDEL